MAVSVRLMSICCHEHYVAPATGNLIEARVGNMVFKYDYDSQIILIVGAKEWKCYGPRHFLENSLRTSDTASVTLF